MVLKSWRLNESFKSNNIDEQNRKIEIEIPDIQSEEKRNLLFGMTLPKLDEKRKCLPIARAVLSYDNCITGQVCGNWVSEWPGQMFFYHKSQEKWI